MKRIITLAAVLTLALAGSAQAGGNPTFGHGGVGAAKKACAQSGGTWISYLQVCS